MRKYTIFKILLLLLFAYCKNPVTNKEIADIENDTGYSTVTVNNKLYNIPSPYHISQWICHKGIPYRPELLNKPENVQFYASTSKQALNIGVYGVNLAYLTLYKKNYERIIYFNTLKYLFKEQSMANLNEHALLKRFEANATNTDSLLLILSAINRKVEEFLQSNKKEETNALILVGSWIESMYLLTSLITSSKDNELTNQLAEQKNVLDNLISLLRPYYTSKETEFGSVFLQLTDIASIFEGVEVKTTVTSIEANPKQKLSKIKCRKKIELTNYQFITIKDSINSLRNRIIKTNRH